MAGVAGKIKRFLAQFYFPVINNHDNLVDDDLVNFYDPDVFNTCRWWPTLVKQNMIVDMSRVLWSFLQRFCVKGPLFGALYLCL